MQVAVVTMGKIGGKYSRVDHCCFGLTGRRIFPAEAFFFYSMLKSEGFDACFCDGNLFEDKEVLSLIKKEKPETVVYYVHTPYIRHKIMLLEEIAKESKLYLVLVPFFWDKKILEEFPFIENCVYDGKSALEIELNENLVVEYDLDLSPYYKRGFPVLAGKYCPYSCWFCNARNTGLFERPAEVIAEEVKRLHKRGFSFYLMDNNLTLNRDRFFQICELMKNIGVKWSSDGRVDHIDEEMVLSLREAGGSLLFGFESASQEVLNRVQKGFRKEDIMRCANLFNRFKAKFRFSVLFGFPWDSLKTFAESLELMKRAQPYNYSFNFVAPYPGFPLFEEFVRLGLINEKELDYEDFSFEKMPLAPTLYLSKKELKALVKEGRLRTAFRARLLFSLLEERSLLEFPSILAKALKLIITGKTR